MKISVKPHNGHRILIYFPSLLALNPLTARLISRFSEKSGIHITVEQAAAIINGLNYFRRTHRDWKLVEVQSANGDAVEIKL